MSQNVESEVNDLGTHEVPYENICSCNSCDHDLARDCAKAKCSCCNNQSHSMIMDGIQGFFTTDKVE